MIDSQIGRQLSINTRSVRKLEEPLAGRGQNSQEEEEENRCSWRHHKLFFLARQTHVKHKESFVKETNRWWRFTITHYELHPRTNYLRSGSRRQQERRRTLQIAQQSIGDYTGLKEEQDFFYIKAYSIISVHFRRGKNHVSWKDQLFLFEFMLAPFVDQTAKRWASDELFLIKLLKTAIFVGDFWFFYSCYCLK